LEGEEFMKGQDRQEEHHDNINKGERKLGHAAGIIA
jgi:hypothetical protein